MEKEIKVKEGKEKIENEWKRDGKGNKRKKREWKGRKG